jgi:hypothetical protein
MDSEDWVVKIYELVAMVVGFLAFLGIWFYALEEWGLLLGLMFGWVPATIGAGLCGFLWPLIALIVI